VQDVQKGREESEWRTGFFSVDVGLFSVDIGLFPLDVGLLEIIRDGKTDRTKINLRVATCSSQVSFAKEPYKRDDILQKRPDWLLEIIRDGKTDST